MIRDTIGSAHCKRIDLEKISCCTHNFLKIYVYKYCWLKHFLWFSVHYRNLIIYLRYLIDYIFPPVITMCFNVRNKCVCPVRLMLLTVHRKIRLIEGNAKCHHLKKNYPVKGTLRQVYICLRPRTSYLPSPLTHCIRVYSTVYLFTQGKKGEVNQREG
jgi:hypothetical protein